MDRRSGAVAAVVVAVGLACGGGGGGGAPGAIVADGGQGLAGRGGNGGTVTVFTGSGGDVVLQPGARVPDMAIPAVPDPELGSNPLTVDADRTLDITQPWFGDDGTNAATGLWVKKGARLLIDSHGGFGVTLHFDGGIRIDGVVVFPPSSEADPDESMFQLDAGGDLVVSGTVETSGAEGGGNAASLALTTRGRIRNSGKLLARGGNGAVGGAGGTILGNWSGAMVNTGFLDSSGGEGTAGAGGAAGGISLGGSNTGSTLWSGGGLQSLGGSGTTRGGNGGHVVLTVYGDALIGGPIEASGGSATGMGDGGKALGIECQVVGGRLVATGSLKGRGGAGAGTGNGALGATIALVDQNDLGRPAAQVGMFVSGSVDASGGTGSAGGAGGIVTLVFTRFGEGHASGPVITLSGIASVHASGGPGSAAAGDAQEITIESVPTAIGPGAYAGSVLAAVDIAATGGAGGTGNGGQGGTVLLRGSDLTCKDVDASGGASAEASGGQGGTIDVSAPGVLDHGTLTAAGGAGGGGNGLDGVVHVHND